MAWTFDAPGFETDFSDPTKWHDRMKREAAGIVATLASEVLGKARPSLADINAVRADLAYADPTAETIPDDAKEISTTPWLGFPQSVERRRWPDITEIPDLEDPQGYYRAVEDYGNEDIGNAQIFDLDGHIYSLPVRHRQDEYLEWQLSQDARRITFVCEGYDYFSALYRADEKAVVDLYQDFVGDTSITADDLRAHRGLYFNDRGRRRVIAAPGEFNPRNQFNIYNGICHLSHRANSLGAEVNLAGVSALARLDSNGGVVMADDAERLICCNESGSPNRNSDPSISREAYAQVLDGFRFTLSNPVGLYIAGVDPLLMMPNNTDPIPETWWRHRRGSGTLGEDDSRILRLDLEIPAGEVWAGRQMTLGDLKLGGGPVRFPGQIAELVKVHLFLTRWQRPGGGKGPFVPCTGTCCRVDGSLLLVNSNGACRPGTSPAFPDLLSSDASGHDMFGPRGGDDAEGMETR